MGQFDQSAILMIDSVVCLYAKVHVHGVGQLQGGEQCGQVSDYLSDD